MNQKVLNSIAVRSLLLMALGAALLLAPRPAAADELKWDAAKGQALLRKAASGDNIRFMWWNVHNGMTNSAPEPTLSRNISNLIHSELAPDVLAFGEYRVENLGPAGLDDMLKMYPNHLEESYPASPGYGLGIYSRYPFEILSVDTLDYAPLSGMNSSSLAAYHLDWCGTSGICLRPLVIVRLNVKGKEIDLVVVHLFDAWRKYRRDNGVLSTAWQVMLGSDNPLWFQIERFRGMMAARLGKQLTDGNVVIMGDFNMPKSVFGVKTDGYDALSEGLVDALSGNTSTFPAHGSEEHSKYPSMQIDHVFISPKIKVQHGYVLPLRGSDHYPIYVGISPP